MSNKELKELEKIMSAFTDTANTLIATIAQGGADDQATKDAITALQAHLASDEANEADTQTVVTELLNKLAVSTPPAAAAGTDTAALAAAGSSAS